MEFSGNRRAQAVIVLSLLVPISIFAACLFGAYPTESAQVLAAFKTALGLGADKVDSALSFIIIDLRLSRVCLSFLVGMSLAVAGTVYQGILRNPLADPFTLGVSSGAAFGASLAIFSGSTMLGAELWSRFGNLFLPLAALAGAMAALGAVLMLGRIGGRLRRETMVLAGIVVATFLSALISLLKSLDEESVTSIVFWIMGSFQGRGWSHLQLFMPYFIAGMIPLIYYSRELDILSLGETQARHLGMDVSRVRMALLIGSGLLTGAAVAVSGIIGFVGLIVPHLVRMFQGAEHRPLLLSSSLLGGLLLVWSDVIARSLLSGGEELPVGVVTALLGGPFFCIVLRSGFNGSSGAGS
ncbi:iron ABC transporter permease [Desulfovibrio sp. JC022]|uniref:FecCD family ABC transporter permease n=1 Tax=Desulfovibrio sp. JC022 TaxID=2593642 RepID=UPI0013D22E82|nr:iron ABC transporter permease [Desulfovibrio sp. JC022]NDV21727.1 iron ABC transporter permease [Desulfovibrio sp. JC022]